MTKNRRPVHIEQRYVLDLRKIKTQKKTFEIHHLTDNNQKRWQRNDLLQWGSTQMRP